MGVNGARPLVPQFAPKSASLAVGGNCAVTGTVELAGSAGFGLLLSAGST